MNLLITGTSRGIGRSLLIEALRKGHQVISISRNPTLIEKEFSESEKSNWTELQGSLLDDSTYQLLGKKLSAWKRLDLVINNAGYLSAKPFHKLSQVDFEQTFLVNTYAPAKLIQHCLGHLRNTEKSRVINIGSIGGIQGSVKFSGLSFYSASKGALAILTECLAEEHQDAGITFNYLALGAVQTEMLEAAFPGYEAPVTSDQMAQFILNYAETGARITNGKLIPVSLTTP